MKKKILLFFIGITTVSIVKAQFVYGTTGLLHMPTADMQQDKTFMFGGTFLDEQATPKHWYYDTFNYYVNITFFPWLEVGYTCTLHRMTVPSAGIYHKFTNQDRQFSGRLRIWKEGWWKNWTPQIVVGANDPSTNDIYTEGKDEYGITGVGRSGNGHWNRYYIAATKHIEFRDYGNLGIHVAYLYNRRRDYHLNGPAIGANFQFDFPAINFWNKALNGLNLMAEYDSRTINVGGSYSLWKDHINLIAELNDGKYFSGGVFFKVHLK